VRSLVAELDGEVVGWVSFGENRDADVAPEVGELRALFVAPRAWRRGAGRALVAGVLDGLRELGYRQATLWSFDRNDRANAFYERQGFARDGAEQRREAFAGALEVRYRRSLEDAEDAARLGEVDDRAGNVSPPGVGGTTRRRVLGGIVFAACVVAFLYFVLPKLAGFDETWSRFKEGDPVWLAVALVLELASFGGYLILFRGVFARELPQVRWRHSYQITMAGLAATRLFAAGGAGGVALTAWALRRAGMPARRVAARMMTFMVALYWVYTSALLVDGLLLRTGILSGSSSFALTVVPAVFGGVAMLIALAAALVPADLGRRWELGVRGPHWVATAVKWLGRVPATLGAGVRGGLQMLRDRDLALLGALAWWGFDMSVLWACFHAFGGDPPPWGALVMAYFLGMLGNTLPLPGGIGGVEGGMIGALIAFDVPGGLAVVAVLAYRVFSFWLPTIPGAIAYLGLRRTVREWQEEPAAGAEPAPSRA
jgi:uncharacterized protein (TIRG00374 family)